MESASKKKEASAQQAPPSPSSSSTVNLWGLRGSELIAGAHALQDAATVEVGGGLIVISNRLPITCKKTIEMSDKGKKQTVWTFTRSSGGLVAALSGIKTSFTWIGWPGIFIKKEDEKREIEQRLLTEFTEFACIPVWLDATTMDEYYDGFSNGILWPLFHYMENFRYEENLYKSYKHANQVFADTVAKVYKEGKYIWVHDYHLMLMPAMIRQRIPNARMGFFLHIPFPSSELFKLLPVRAEILEGMLNCDLVGFHTFDYGRHFLQSCTRILGAETSSKSVVFMEDRAVPVGVFPVGIDPINFLEGLETKEIQERIKELETRYEGKKVIIGVDRLDYIKGIPQKLQALDLFFQKYPEWREKVVLIQVAVPSREAVDEYQKLKREVDELVTEINSKYGTLDYLPIRYLYHSVSFNELSALYAVSDAALITSLRDGMNLVCLEYISCQQNRHGVLILSEFAGAAQSLSGSIRVNPWKTKDVANAIHKALTMDEERKARANEMLFNYVMTHTASDWGRRFIQSLKTSSEMKEERVQSSHTSNEVIAKYAQFKKHLLVFAYDGTLVPFEHIPSLSKPPSKVLDQLRILAHIPGNTVIIVSGRDRNTMEEWFSQVPEIGLGAEHGSFFRPPNSRDWESLIDHLSNDWKDAIRPVLKHYTDRTPGASCEEKEVTFTWHYRYADTSNGATQACDLQIHLESNFGRWPIEVLHINKAIEIRPNDVSATSMIKRFLNSEYYAAENTGETAAAERDKLCVMYVGDSLVVPAEINRLWAVEHPVEVITCGVGRKKTIQRADLYMTGPEQVHAFLEKLLPSKPTTTK
eukprot:TRINITY_DN1196_c0_g1_i2.p1 TRINITY_DN1196_c0_g1~~TRINITY_DN1196_c0_g1_i2.p1  ORF type:complete len:815 (+),score=144.02 TRINITY_DN1196_c0_g1_i2:169-2613(+)